MDDGGKLDYNKNSKNKSVVFNTQSFSESEVFFMAKELSSKFDLECEIRSNKGIVHLAKDLLIIEWARHIERVDTGVRESEVSYAAHKHSVRRTDGAEAGDGRRPRALAADATCRGQTPPNAFRTTGPMTRRRRGASPKIWNRGFSS